MSKNKIIIFLTLIVVGIGLFLWLPKEDHGVDRAHKDIYYCPMHPTYTSDRPGLCPICNMSLVKRVDQNQPPRLVSVAGYSDVSLDKQKMQLIGIETTTVVKKPLVKTIHAYGIVAHDLELYEAQLEYIDAWRVFYAFLSRRPVTDDYSANWREYYLKSPTKDRWRSDEKVKAQERFVKAEYELIHMGLTNQELEKLRKVKYGQLWIQPELLFFDKDQPAWVYAQVFENDLGYLAVGQKAVVNILAYNEITEGVVLSISPVIDPITRTSRVRVELPNYKGELNINMFVNVEVASELNSALLIPRAAVMDTGLRKIVFIQVNEGSFEPREVKTGMEGNGMVSVSKGLKEGDVVVSSGNFLLDSESRLKAAIDSTSEVQHVH